MTTENFNLKVDDIIVGNDGMGDRIGYYIETITDNNGIRIVYSSTKKNTGSSRAFYTRRIDQIRLASPEEVATFQS